LKTAETREELVTLAKIKLQNQSRQKNINLEFIDLKESKDADGKGTANFCVYFQALLPGRFGFDLIEPILRAMMPVSKNAVFHVFLSNTPAQMAPELPNKNYPSGISLNTLFAERNIFLLDLPEKDQQSDSLEENSLLMKYINSL